MPEIIHALIPPDPSWRHVILVAMVCATFCYLARTGLLRTLAVAAHHQQQRVAIAQATTDAQLAALAPGGKVPGPTIGVGVMLLLLLGAGLVGGAAAPLVSQLVSKNQAVVQHCVDFQPDTRPAGLPVYTLVGR
jgi:hypothetical protein